MATQFILDEVNKWTTHPIQVSEALTGSIDTKNRPLVHSWLWTTALSHGQTVFAALLASEVADALKVESQLRINVQ